MVWLDLGGSSAAKLNLSFDVLTKRGDGYHQVETLMVPITLFDALGLRHAPEGDIRLECAWAAGLGAGGGELEAIPEGRGNLVVRAAELLQQRSATKAGARITLVKRIPAAAGLGGGSSDAAAALLALNALWGLEWSREQLAQLANELGSDVPFFLGHGPAICRGRGEQVFPVGGLGHLHFVVVGPPGGLSTAEVYAACRPASQPASTPAVVSALRAGDTPLAGRLLHNGLQPAAEKLSPWIGRLSKAFDGLDCLGHQMSGSGTSYFGMCRHARHARRVASQLRLLGLGSVYATSSCN